MPSHNQSIPKRKFRYTKGLIEFGKSSPRNNLKEVSFRVTTQYIPTLSAEADKDHLMSPRGLGVWYQGPIHRFGLASTLMKLGDLMPRVVLTRTFSPDIRGKLILTAPWFNESPTVGLQFPSDTVWAGTTS